MFQFDAYESRSIASAPAVNSRPAGASTLPTIVGYAAVFNSLSEPLADKRGQPFREIVRPGAFLRSLADAAQGRADIMARFDHEGILGRTSNGTLRLREDERGLRYEIDLPDTQAGRDLATLIKRGDVRGASFGFKANKDNWRSDKAGQLRELLDVRLLDVSPVTSAAYPAATAKVLDNGPTGTMQMRLALAEAL
jgi:Escherichia/Staphylococcus phage prohead protease